MECPICKSEITRNQKFCKNCGTKIEYHKNIYFLLIRKFIQKNKKIILSLLIIILFLRLSCILSDFNMNSLPKCDSSFTEKEIIEQYKTQEDNYSYYLNNDSSLQVELLNPRAKSYDKDINKYFCEGEIHVYSQNGNFQNVDWYGKYITGLEYKVEYEINMSKDKPLIISNFDFDKYILGEETEESIQRKLKYEEEQRQRELEYEENKKIFEQENRYKELQDMF